MSRFLKNMKVSLSYTFANLTLLDIVRWVIVAISLLNLTCMPVYSDAMLLLEDQICGFIMFLFILAGLMAMFFAFRLDGEKWGNTICVALAMAASTGFGVWLMNILMYALYYQASLKSHAVVVKGINFGLGICIAYGVAIVAVLFVQILYKVKPRKSKPL